MPTIFHALSLSAILGLGVGCAEVRADPVGTSAAAAQQIDITSLETALQAGDPVVLIDVRTPQEFAQGRVPGARNIPLDELGGRLDELNVPEGGTLYVVCHSGNRSGKAARMLATKGISSVNVTGGTSAWQRAGKTIER